MAVINSQCVQLPRSACHSLQMNMHKLLRFYNTTNIIPNSINIGTQTDKKNEPSSINKYDVHLV